MTARDDALALMHERGITGSDAETSLKTFEARAHAAGDRDLVDAAGRLLSIETAGRVLRVRHADRTPADQSLALSAAYGSDAARTATVLMLAR